MDTTKRLGKSSKHKVVSDTPRTQTTDTLPAHPAMKMTPFKTRLKNKILPSSDTEYDDGDISISEIMYDPGPDRNRVQWIELYNSSKTQAVSLKGWELEIRNLEYETGAYVDGTFSFEDAVILPNQTLLLVSESGANNVSEQPRL